MASPSRKSSSPITSPPASPNRKAPLVTPPASPRRTDNRTAPPEERFVQYTVESATDPTGKDVTAQHRARLYATNKSKSKGEYVTSWHILNEIHGQIQKTGKIMPAPGFDGKVRFTVTRTTGSGPTPPGTGISFVLQPRVSNTAAAHVGKFLADDLIEDVAAVMERHHDHCYSIPPSLIGNPIGQYFITSPERGQPEVYLFVDEFLCRPLSQHRTSGRDYQAVSIDSIHYTLHRLMWASWFIEILRAKWIEGGKNGPEPVMNDKTLIPYKSRESWGGSVDPVTGARGVRFGHATVDHIDHDPTNNRLSNLRVVSYWENNRHSKAATSRPENDWLWMEQPPRDRSFEEHRSVRSAKAAAAAAKAPSAAAAAASSSSGARSMSISN